MYLYAWGSQNLAGCLVLTFRPFLVERFPCQQFGFHSHIARRGCHGRIDGKLLESTIIPRVPAECFPDAQHCAGGGDIDAIWGEYIFGAPNIEQVGLGLGRREGPKDEGCGASQRGAQWVGDKLRIPIGAFARWKGGQSGMCASR